MLEAILTVIIAYSIHSAMGSDLCQTMGEARGVAGYPRPAAEAVISSHRLSGERVCLRLPDGNWRSRDQ
jgi:hypothetical protein